MIVRLAEREIDPARRAVLALQAAAFEARPPPSAFAEVYAARLGSPRFLCYKARAADRAPSLSLIDPVILRLF